MDISDRAKVMIAIKDELWDLNQEDRSIILAAFGIDDPSEYDYDTAPSMGQILAKVDEERLLQLARHFGIDLPQSAQVAAVPAASPTNAEPLFVFASHLSMHKRLIWDVSQEMKVFGIELFVAHVSIPDDSPWQDEIPNGLNKAHAAVAFLHKGFKESDWCDQEVGWLLGRGVPVLGLTFDIGPYGPMGRLQAAPAGKLTPEQIADNLVTRLSAKPQLQANLTASFIQGLHKSGRFRDTDRIWEQLREFTGLGSQQCADLLAATQDNHQVYNARCPFTASQRPYPRVILDFLKEQPGWTAIQNDAEEYSAKLDRRKVLP
ncbi:toll/interleukin-1 receptor domain-containing protein [Rhodococcus pyridinivorans]|uniref:TIR domain-containing protein n=1 Tax=Rhodococcus pyridinivorans TaxID=103816 RepID=UPI0020C72858|nr:TIR domain-containing protein [Rhodococcus pyridinivorans]UTM37640.1 toll/interleukin-1 receptor domain-containing protein [Rhodococcus pyridinivorans]